MPKITTSEPRRDPVKALILERQVALNKSDTDMSELLGVCRQTYSALMHKKHTDDWCLGTITKVCNELNIPLFELRHAIRYH